ncbi:DNA gyrase subunit B [Devosia sp.]|uniref:DUF883 family protein n=1 Tax=Devosia sp. TaxID=1871048 RepID=UPI0032661505
MANTTDLAPTRRKVNGAPRAATASVREKHLEDQISQLQSDLKGIAATLARISGDKVNEARDTAKSEYRNLRAQGQHVVADVQDQAGQVEKQIKDTIREKPLTAVASAVGIGFLLALFSRL